MIRTHLVKSLYQKLLGPEFGPEETVEYPFQKYITGILSTSFIPPDASKDPETDVGVKVDPADKLAMDSRKDKKKSFSSDEHSIDDSSLTFAESSLDPRKGSKSMGVSFVVSSQTSEPKISFCCTWARYDLKDGFDRYDQGVYERVPNFYLSDEISVEESDEKIELDVSSSETQHVTKHGAIIHIKTRKNIAMKDTWTVSVYLENKTILDLKPDAKKDDKDRYQHEWEVHRIFQPQIRIKCSDGTKTEFFEAKKIPEANSSDAKDMLSYAKRSPKATGHQCGGVWHDVDPEQDANGFAKFTWIDSENEKFPKSAKEKFTCPDIRTDYFPSYTILQPDLTEKQDFEAEKFAEMWTGDEFQNDAKNGLRQITTKYLDWISNQEETLKGMELEPNIQKTAEENIRLCKKSHDRIDAGIDFIVKNPKARLAFCFMNKVMAKKMEWDNRNNVKFSGLKWREFQMAFILQSLKGVAGHDDEEKDTCEVLWFPTGGGKTEAYLGLSIFALAFRRLSDDEQYENDGGVTVLSRYTLRLLTIQQFNRAVGSTLAADLLRVANWKPGKLSDSEIQQTFGKDNSKNIWGKSRISIGMWIGGSITPNDFRLYVFPKTNECTLNAEGSLNPESAEVQKTRSQKKSGEPAQVSNCPCCNNLLATNSLKRNKPVVIRWLIKTKKSLETLQKLGQDDFNSKNHKLQLDDIEFSSSNNTISEHKENYFIFKAKLTVLAAEPDKIVNRWWLDIVVKKIGTSENSPVESTSASRPGYFFVTTANGKPFDYSIHCTNQNCELNKPGTRWHETNVENMMASIAKPFLDPNDERFSSSVPISAFTVDSQIYGKCPSFLIATADKFARIPFESRSASIFGNVDVFHKKFGYGRDGKGDVERKAIYRTPLDQGERLKDRLNLENSDMTPVKPFHPPNLIIQDELHLIEGPLGSMMGIYEMAVDVLCSTEKSSPKYIASSATIKESKSQVASVFRRDIAVFPQPGLFSTDTHFSEVNDDITSISDKAGRLHIGVCPGAGTYIIPVKIWAVLLSEIFKIRSNPKLPEYGLEEGWNKNKENCKTFEEYVERKTDLYWTLVGYFSDLELLSRTSNFYRDDIASNVKSFSSFTLDNVELRGFGEQKTKGIRFFPMNVKESFSASHVSLFGQKDGGKISIAIFDDDNDKPGDLVSMPDSNLHNVIKNCIKGENKFELSEKLVLKQNQKIWICVMSNSECVFQTGSELNKIFKSDSLPQKQSADGKTTVDDLEDFSQSKDSIKTHEEYPIKISLKSEPRDLDDSRKIEMSSQTESTELPGILDRLGRKPNNDVDGLLTTPIFGTGIDITRLGLMVVMNQPKTTSQYIQATGRVGRSGPGLVVSWLRAGRHRDLNHYENFIGFHRAIHRYVEPITAAPFSEKTMDGYLGPVIVGILRNARRLGDAQVPLNWVPRQMANSIRKNKNNPEIENLKKLLQSAACNNKIPKIRRLEKMFFDEYFNRAIQRWNDTSQKSEEDGSVLCYYDYSFMYSKDVKDDVVLGTEAHKIQQKKIAYKDARSSLREIEEQVGIGEELHL